MNGRKQCANGREGPRLYTDRRVKKLLTFFVSLAVVSSVAAVDLPPERERWSRLTIGNITICSNAGDRAARGVAEDLLRFRETLLQVMKMELRSPLPTYVYVFGDESSFAPYREVAVGKKSGDVLAMVTQVTGANLMLIRAKSGLGDDRLVYHELTHYLIRNNIAGAPPWLHEGLAGFYETFAPLGMSDSVTIGKPPYKYYDALLASGLIPLRKLFAFQPPREHKSTPELDQFYLQSWFFLHYLLIGNPARGAGLGKYLALTAEGQPMETAFEAAFGATMEAVDAELGKYLHRERFNMIQYSVPRSAAAIPAPVAMPRDQLLYLLGKLLARLNPAAGAEAFLSESVKLNPNNGAAVAELAGVKEALGKPAAEVEALYRQAVAIAGNDPEPYVLASLRDVAAMQQRARAGETVPAERIEHARALAAKAISLAPDDVLANAVLGATYTFAGQDPRKGIAPSKHAFELAPSMIDVAVDLVVLYARAGRMAAAKAMVERFIVPSGETRYIEQAKQDLAANGAH